MPELPEVEVTRLSLAEPLQGARIQSLRLGKPLRWPLGVAPEALQQRQVRQVRRRGKYLLLELDRGLLLLHLGMSGSLRLLPLALPGPAGLQEWPAPGAHDHFDLLTDRGLLRLHDPRRFGAVVYAEGESDPVALKLLGKLGVEPLTPAFEPKAFHAALQLRRAHIKQVLLAGAVVVGVGNIYACEALFAAGIRPTAVAARLSRPRVQRLHAAIVQVLQRALHSGGSTLRNFSNAQGQSGYFQLQTQVYDRAGQPCRVCGTPIRLLRQGQRSSYYCPQCQKP